MVLINNNLIFIDMPKAYSESVRKNLLEKKWLSSKEFNHSGLKNIYSNNEGIRHYKIYIYPRNIIDIYKSYYTYGNIYNSYIKDSLCRSLCFNRNFFFNLEYFQKYYNLPNKIAHDIYNEFKNHIFYKNKLNKKFQIIYKKSISSTNFSYWLSMLYSNNNTSTFYDNFFRKKNKNQIGFYSYMLLDKVIDLKKINYDLDIALNKFRKIKFSDIRKYTEINYHENKSKNNNFMVSDKDIEYIYKKEKIYNEICETLIDDKGK